MFVSWFFVALVALCVIDQTRSLDELPTNLLPEDNDIVKTEAVIRRTTNKLFETLNLKYAHNQPKIKQFSTIHKYFISLTLQDNDSLKEIAQLTRVNNNETVKVIINLITLLNEILDIENLIRIEDVLNGEVDGSYDITNELSKIEYLKNLYMNPDTIMDINGQILKILEEDTSAESLNMNTTSDTPLLYLDNDTVSDNDGYWRAYNTTRTPTRRIFNGYPTKIDHYAFLASVEIFGKFQCGSTIIKSDLAITAASCLQLAWNNRFYRENPAFLSIRVGSSFFESGGESISILEIYFHPTYNPKTLNHNLAIMRTIRHVHWKKRVQRLGIDTQDNPIETNVDGVLIVGWGAKRTSNKLQSSFHNKIHYSILDIYPLEDCQDIYSQRYVTRKHFCGGYASKGDGACNRDVGGPGIVSGILTGIISFGSPVCGTPDAPTVFTKVGYYSDWIEDILEKDVPHTKKRTTRAPKEYLYLPEVTKRPPVNSWSVTPLGPIDKTVTTQATFTVNEPHDFNRKDVQKTEKTMFKDFLKTMFNSDEIQEYLDTVQEKVLSVPLPETPSIPRTPPMDNRKTTTKSRIPPENIIQQPETATRIENFDPSSPSFTKNYGKSDTNEEFSLTTTTHKKTRPTRPTRPTRTTRPRRPTKPMDRQDTAISFDDTKSGHELDEDLEISDIDDLASIKSFETKVNNMKVNNPEQDLEKRIQSIVNDVAQSLEHRKIVQLKDSEDKTNNEHNYDSVELKKDLKAKESLIESIDKAVLSLWHISGERNKEKILPLHSSAEHSENAERERKHQESNTINAEELRDHKESAVNSAPSSDYESEGVELVIPVRTTAILEIFTYPQTTPYAAFSLPKIKLPKQILPKRYRQMKHQRTTPEISDMADLFFLPNVSSMAPNRPAILNMPILQWPLESIPGSSKYKSKRLRFNKIHPVEHQLRKPSEFEGGAPSHARNKGPIQRPDPENSVAHTEKVHKIREFKLDETRHSIKELKKFQKKRLSKLRNLAKIDKQDKTGEKNNFTSQHKIEQYPVRQTFAPPLSSENENNKQADVNNNVNPMDKYLIDLIKRFSPAKKELKKNKEVKADDVETLTEASSSTLPTSDDYDNDSYVANYDVMVESLPKYNFIRSRDL